MGKKHGSRFFLFGLVTLLIAWPFYQIYYAFHHKEGHEDAGKMLFQVAQFQMELLTNYLSEASGVQDSVYLNELKQVAYSANYTHERLALAYKDDDLTELSCIGQLLQFILRIQLGGERPLQPGEKAALVELQKPFRDLYDQYTKLISPGGYVIALQNEKVAKADKAISDQIRKTMTK